MGKIELDHTGSGSGITLSSDGTDLLLDGTAIGGGGGGGADLYAANESSPTAQPSATGTNAIAIGDSAVSTGTDSFALGKARATGARSFAVHTGTNIANGATTSDCIAIGEFAKATNSMAVAIGRSASATNSQSLSLGFVATATGTQSTAIQRGLASGADSFAAHITNNTSSYGATGSNSVAIGKNAKASGNYSLAIGGYNSAAFGVAAVSIGGNQANKAYGNASFCIGGYQAWNEASDDNSFAMGEGAKSAVKGKLAYAGGRFSSIGDAQGGQFILRADTTDATATVLTTNNSSSGSTNQIVAASDTCITFDGTITAMQNGAQSYASWKIEGLLVNDGGTTTLSNSSTTVIQNSPSWGMTLSADNANNALAITVTGEAAHNIRWVANIRTSEVTYA